VLLQVVFEIDTGMVAADGDVIGHGPKIPVFITPSGSHDRIVEEVDPLWRTRNNFQHLAREASPVSHPIQDKFSFGPLLHAERTIDHRPEEVKGSNSHPHEGVINDRS
jgi:hypothetical protein